MAQIEYGGCWDLPGKSGLCLLLLISINDICQTSAPPGMVEQQIKGSVHGCFNKTLFIQIVPAEVVESVQ